MTSNDPAKPLRARNAGRRPRADPARTGPRLRTRTHHRGGCAGRQRGPGTVRWEEHRPDVVVTDLQLPDGTGFDIIRAIRQQSTTVGLVMLTMHSGDEQIFTAMEAGASAFVGKDAPVE